jgi:hypothetical protein
MTRQKTQVALLILLATAFGCEERLDLSTLPQPEVSTLDTSYVRLDPPFGGFVGAGGILIGNDQLLYVADTRANRVVMMNRGGQILSTRTVLQPLALTQDSRLDLLVGAVVVAANGDTAGAILRIQLVSEFPDSAHRLGVAPMDTVWIERAHPQRRFVGMTAFGDNTYLALRSGPDNSSFIDPDARVLLFDSHDRFVTPLPGLISRTGSGITDINRPTAIASFPGVRDFILTQLSEGVAYGAIWLRYELSSEFEGWLPRFDPARPEDLSIDFIRPNRFLSPVAVTIDRAHRDVFIADATLDSVVKFTSRGTFKGESFGRVRSGGVMRRPSGLAFYENVLYVLDGETGQILRYRLSSDVPR